MAQAAVKLREPDSIPPRDTAGRAKILVVDDDERNLLALREVLEPLADVVTVSSGKEALRRLLRDEFAVILLDVFMPEMDGYETAAFIREREQTSRIPIIFLSAVNKETEHLLRGYGMGAVDYVFKPVDPLILRSKAAVFVDLYELRREVEERNRAEQELADAKLRAEQQRLEIERELQSTRLRQAAILNSLPVVLFEASYSETRGLQRRIVGRSERVGGIDLKIDEHDAWERRIPPEDREIVAREYAAKTREGERATIRYRWIADTGAAHHFLEQAVRTAEDLWVGSITDITAQSTLENQLMQAQKLDALGQLTGGVAHDFNNLLAAFLGGLELLERRVDFDAGATVIVEKLRQAANEGTALVRSLLAFARKQPLVPVPVDPDHLRTSTLSLAEHALGKGHAVEWKSECGDCQFFADPAQLTLAVLNLIINARDAMPEGGLIEVAVDLEAEPAGPARNLCVAVRDSGTGIPAEIAERITEPFFTTKPVGKGTGLGLSMVAGFVAQSGGKLAFHSRPTGGTEVRITLPAAHPCEPSRREANNAIAGGGTRQRSILLVDDDELVRTIVADVLEELGSAVTAAKDGIEALELLTESSRYDLILSDIAMPRMDGIELVQSLERKEIQIPVALMSGNPDPDLCAKLPDRIVVLAKPLSAQKLSELLNEL